MAPADGVHQQIVDACVDGLWLVDAGGRTMFANTRLAELLGRPASELSRIGVAEALGTGSWADADAGSVDVQRVCERPDGTRIPLLVSERTLRDADGRTVGRLYQVVDDRRRWSLLDEVSRGRSQLAEAQSIARLGSWELRVAPREVTWSEGMYDVLGVDRATFDPGPEAFAAMILESDRSTADENWQTIIDQPGEHCADFRIRRGDGEVRWLRAVGRTVERGADGRPVRFAGTIQDVHEIKSAERTLLDAVEINTLMQVLATAANESRTFDEALGGCGTCCSPTTTGSAAWPSTSTPPAGGCGSTRSDPPTRRRRPTWSTRSRRAPCWPARRCSRRPGGPRLR